MCKILSVPVCKTFSKSFFLAFRYRVTPLKNLFNNNNKKPASKRCGFFFSERVEIRGAMNTWNRFMHERILISSDGHSTD